MQIDENEIFPNIGRVVSPNKIQLTCFKFNGRTDMTLST